MSSNNIRAIVVEDNKKWIEQIKAVLPEYIKIETVSYAEAQSKINYIKGVTTIVIMNADDIKGRSLSIFKYINEDTEKTGLSCICAVLCTNDQFSDKAFEFYDYGEPLFHEGTIDDTEFFNIVNDAIDMADEKETTFIDAMSAENVADIDKNSPDDIVHEPGTSPDKIMGMTFKVQTGEKAPLRTVAYTGDKMAKALEKATNNSIEVAKKVASVVEDVVKEKEEAGEPLKYIKKSKKGVSEVTHNEKKEKVKLSNVGKDNSKPLGSKKEDISRIHKISNLDKIKKLLNDEELFPNKENDNKSIIPTMSGKVNQQNFTGIPPQQNMDTSQGLFFQQLQMYNKVTNETKEASRKWKILVVDTDERTYKACQLFLPADNYEIAFVNSNMKAVDYFIKNNADIVLIENDMPYIKGTMILNSIKMQPKGRGVRAALFVKDSMSMEEINAIKSTSGVMAVVNKPIVKKQLIQAINACLA